MFEKMLNYFLTIETGSGVLWLTLDAILLLQILRMNKHLKRWKELTHGFKYWIMLQYWLFTLFLVLSVCTLIALPTKLLVIFVSVMIVLGIVIIVSDSLITIVTSTRRFISDLSKSKVEEEKKAKN